MTDILGDGISTDLNAFGERSGETFIPVFPMRAYPPDTHFPSGRYFDNFIIPSKEGGSIICATYLTENGLDSVNYRVNGQAIHLINDQFRVTQEDSPEKIIRIIEGTDKVTKVE